MFSKFWKQFGLVQNIDYLISAYNLLDKIFHLILIVIKLDADGTFFQVEYLFTTKRKLKVFSSNLYSWQG